MRQSRMKVPCEWEVGYYHCLSRVVDRAYRLGDAEKEQFAQIMREYESFCGVRILTFCLMSNHFHILVEVPRRPQNLPSADDVLEKLESLTCEQDFGWVRQAIERFRERNDAEGERAFLERFYRRMWDVSWFIRLIKQRFSMWYNRRTGRKGTLWEDRFKSVMVEGAGQALVTMAAYIDLNPVRAKAVRNPQDYRWSGYGEAIAGKRRSREGLQRVVTALTGGQEPPGKALELYRMHVYGQGHEENETMLPDGSLGRGAFGEEQVLAVLNERGRLPAREYVRCRVRYFCDGAVLGSREYVDAMFQRYRHWFGTRRKTGARRMRGVQEDLYALRDLRSQVFG